MLATSVTRPDETVVMRDMCHFPEITRYDGSGNPDLAAVTTASADNGRTCAAVWAPPGPPHRPGEKATVSVHYESADQLEQALRRAALAHGAHERAIGHEDADWPTWYAHHMVREQAQRPASAERYRHLPEHLDPTQTVSSHPASPPPDPFGARDTERDFLLRYGAGGDDLEVGDG